MSYVHVPDPTVHVGRPADCGDRLPREAAVYDLLDSLSVPYLRLDHDPLYTIEACHEADELLGVSMCKNLFLCNRTKTEFHLLLMPGEKRFRTGEFSRIIGSSRLSFAPEEAMMSLLGLTPGSVTVLGLMNDKDKRVSLWLDSDLLKEEYLGCHPCVNTSSLRITTRDLLTVILPALGREYGAVTLTGED
jgi:Ala-tRNA(Pro) deacylase